MNSLRTQLCLRSCELVKDLTIVVGPAIDPYADYFLTTFIKLSAANKKLVLQATQVIVSLILVNAPYNHKLTAHIWTAAQDKNQNPRVCAVLWLKVFLEAHGHEAKGAIEHGPGMENVDKILKKGLADPSPDVRGPMRETYWVFAGIWPDKAQVILGKLDAVGRKALEKANPAVKNGDGAASGRSSVLGRSIGLGASTTSAPATTTTGGGQLSGRVSIKKFAAEARRKNEDTATTGGIHSGPVRGLGQPQRPASALKRLESVPGMPRPVSPSSSTTKTTRTGSPPRKGASTRTGSPPSSPKRKAGMRPSRPSPLNTIPSQPGTTTTRPVGRRLTVLEQLVHSEWRIRVEGIVTVACLLAKKDPPGYPPGTKLPTLPPLDTLSPTLQKLLNDPQADVVHHLLAPEVIPEIAKIIPVDMIVPRLLLLSESDDEEAVKDTLSSSLPALKALFSDDEAADMLARTLLGMGVSGVVSRKLSVGFFTTTQKRKIIHGIFLWMIELVERHNAQLASGAAGNAYFADETNFKQYIHRLVPMFTNTKPTSNNYVPLTTLLRALRTAQEDVFDKVLGTFERATVLELKRAWGQPVDEGEDTVLYEEKVVTVHEVLGDVKVGGLTTVVGSSSSLPPVPTTPPRSSRIPVRSPPGSPGTQREFPVTVMKSPGTGFGRNVDEDLTMIGIPPVVPQAGSDKENVMQIDGEKSAPASPKNIPVSPTRTHVRTQSQHSKTSSVPSAGPLSTMANDLRKGTSLRPQQTVFLLFYFYFIFLCVLFVFWVNMRR
jgi:CLIP-associating protein 1/2